MYFITRHIGIEAVPVKIFDVELKTSKNLWTKGCLSAQNVLFFIFQVFKKSDYYIYVQNLASLWRKESDGRYLEAKRAIGLDRRQEIIGNQQNAH